MEESCELSEESTLVAGVVVHAGGSAACSGELNRARNDSGVWSCLLTRPFLSRGERLVDEHFLGRRGRLVEPISVMSLLATAPINAIAARTNSSSNNCDSRESSACSSTEIHLDGGETESSFDETSEFSNMISFALIIVYR
jgi:hypothetical protein